jgi:hypothetical protein
LTVSTRTVALSVSTGSQHCSIDILQSTHDHCARLEVRDAPHGPGFGARDMYVVTPAFGASSAAAAAAARLGMLSRHTAMMVAWCVAERPATARSPTAVDVATSAPVMCAGVAQRCAGQQPW